MAQNRYHCTQQELYTICETGWNSFEEFLPNFTAFRALYDSPYAAARKAEIKAAANLPDNQARNSISQTLRVQLAEQATKCCTKWQHLKRYITYAYPESLHQIKTDAAGQQYYEAAGNEDWDACKGLLTAANTFITANTAELADKLNMPATFPADFDKEKTTFEELHQAFINSEEQEKVETNNKITANNNIFDTTMAMFLDGQQIFKDNEPVKAQFIFEQVLNLASGTGTAGIKGQITDKETGLPITNVKLTIEATTKETTTNEEGKYTITQVAAGKYKITITAEGYQPQSILQEIKTGTISTLNLQLVKI